jgi:cytochrome P450
MTSPCTLPSAGFVTEDLVIGGAPIPAGDTVMVGIGAANRDPGEFDHPHVMDFRLPVTF